MRDRAPANTMTAGTRRRSSFVPSVPSRMVAAALGGITICAMTDEDPVSSQWHALLTGEDQSLVKVRRRWRHVPSAPRCKVCASPFHGFGGVVAKLFWHG